MGNALPLPLRAGEDRAPQIRPRVAFPSLVGVRRGGLDGEMKYVQTGVPSGPDVGDVITSYAPLGTRTCTKDIGDGGLTIE